MGVIDYRLFAADDRPFGGYYRLSKKDQVTPDATESHRFQLRKAIESLGKRFDDCFIFFDQMRGKRSDRKEFQRMLKMVAEGELSGVAVRLDRLSRDAELFFELSRIFQQSNTPLYDLLKRDFINFDEPSQWAEYHKKGIDADYESRVLSVRVKYQKEFLRSTGKAQGGRSPYGYRRNENGFYEVDETKRSQATRRIQIFLESNGSAIESVRRIYEEFGVSITYVGFIKWLENVTLRGYVPYDLITKGSKVFPKSLGAVSHEALIDPATAKQIDTLLSINNRVRGSNHRHERDPLAGLLYCGRCGSSAIVSAHKNRDGVTYRRYTVCYLRKSKGSNCISETTTYTPYDVVEKAVIRALIVRAEELSKHVFATRKIVKHETVEIKSLRAKIKRCSAMLTDDDPDMLDLINSYKRKLNGLLRELSEPGNSDMVYAQQNLVDLIMGKPDVMIDLPREDKMLVFHEFIERVEIDGRDVKVKLKV